MVAQRLTAAILLIGAGAVVLSVFGGAGPSPLPSSQAATPSRSAAGTTPVPGISATSPRHAVAAAVQRPAPAAVPPALAKAVAWAKTRAEHDFHEVGTTNCSPSIARWERHMGLDVPAAPPCRPWCGAFIHEAFLQSGIDLSQHIIDPNQAYADAVAHRNGLQRIPKRSVRPGDLLFFALDKAAIAAGAQASHVAIVVGMPRDGRVRTAEGNVGHHAVSVRRGLRYVVLAARVTLKPART